MMFNQHAALNMARQVQGELLRQADRERMLAENRRHRPEHGSGEIRRRIGAVMIHAGERMQGPPRREADSLPGAC